MTKRERNNDDEFKQLINKVKRKIMKQYLIPATFSILAFGILQFIMLPIAGIGAYYYVGLITIILGFIRGLI